MTMIDHSERECPLYHRSRSIHTSHVTQAAIWAGVRYRVASSPHTSDTGSPLCPQVDTGRGRVIGSHPQMRQRNISPMASQRNQSRPNPGPYFGNVERRASPSPAAMKTMASTFIVLFFGFGGCGTYTTCGC